MTLQARLQGINRLFLDTAPIIYFVEKHPRYLSLMELVFERIDDGVLTVVTSPITLAECLVLPLRQGSAAVVDLFTRTIVAGPSCEFVPIDQQIAHRLHKYARSTICCCQTPSRSPWRWRPAATPS